jgi:2-methylcitrate dehydratase
VRKFRTLAAEALEAEEIERFLDVAQRLPELGADQLAELSFTAKYGYLAQADTPAGLF